MYTEAEKKEYFELNDDPKAEKPLRTEIRWRGLFDEETVAEAESDTT